MNHGGDFTPPYYPPPPPPYHHHYPPPPPQQPPQQPPPPPPSQPPQQPPSFASAPPFSSPQDYPSPYPPHHNYPSTPPFPSIPDHLPLPQPIIPDFPNPNPNYGYDKPYHYPPYEPHQPAVTSYPNPNTNPNPSPSHELNQYSYDPKPYDYAAPKFDQVSPSYYDDQFSGYGSGRSDIGYGKRHESDRRYDYHDSGMYKDDGVYAYEGKSEPYGARGTGSKSSTWSGSGSGSGSSMFDDYGRPISMKGEDKKSGSSSVKVVRAVPKAEVESDGKSGVQKFRVKLLAESGGQSAMDVLCTVGLDGIRMLDPSTSRTLRIYPLENVTRCDKIDSSTFAFWSKTSVDIEPRRIRLQSNSYTTNTILDTVTAAVVQFKEMGGRIRPSESFKAPEQPAEKKKGFTDWMSKLKPVNEEKDHWVPDEAVSKCTGCGADFSAFNRRHHCRNCGDVFCDKCTQGRTPLTADDSAQPVRVCDRCMAEVTHRLSKAKEVANKPASLQSHEDLARKLQEEMEKNLRISSGSKSEGSRRMKEVACPTCTVHLQVQVPSSGSETIECGVCQHPFRVSAH